MQAEPILKFFAQFIELELGIVYADHNYYQLQNRLEEISKYVGVSNITKLHEMAQAGITGSLKQLLLDVATNNETSFFRDPKVFKAIESLVLPAFKSSGRGIDEFLIWSAASSTGQEALSIAMTVLEWSRKQAENFKFSIQATDISERVLTRARAAQYTQLEIQRGLPAAYLVKYFKKCEGDTWAASKELTQHIEYKTANLKEPFLFTKKFNLILCRNVLIYQSIEGKIEILNRITKTLDAEGFLILGSGESLLGLSSDYEQCAVEGVVIYRKRQALGKAG